MRVARLIDSSLAGENTVSGMIVRELRNRKVRFGDPENPGWLPAGAAKPLPDDRTLNLRIEEEVERGHRGYLLIAETTNGEFLGDTWHESLEDAIQQAEFEYGIERREWQEG